MRQIGCLGRVVSAVFSLHSLLAMEATVIQASVQEEIAHPFNSSQEALKEGIQDLVEAWGLAQCLGAQRVEKHACILEPIARGDGLCLWQVTAERTLTPATLRQWLRQLGGHGEAPLFVGEDDKGAFFACPLLDQSEVLLRRLTNVDLSQLIAVGADCRQAGVEALLIALEGLLRGEEVGRAFVRDFKAVWRRLSQAWENGPKSEEGRAELSLITLSRLLFLAFVQQRGWLDGRPHFLGAEAARCHAAGENVYQRFLSVLFFEVLNTPIEQRSERARSLGKIPYLNGGLFAPQPLELAAPTRAVANEALLEAIELLFERYAFATSEQEATHGPQAGLTIAPAMLGRVFEALMDSSDRARSGTFYTPQKVVEGILRASFKAFLKDKVPAAQAGIEALIEDNSAQSLAVNEAQRLDAVLEEIRILDPAAGSGAFLVAAHELLVQLRASLRRRAQLEVDLQQLRLHVATQNLYGVDLLPRAIRLCELRLWLALSINLNPNEPSAIPPLPNLDLAIRQGDALLEAGGLDRLLAIGASTPSTQKARFELGLFKANYRHATGPIKAALGRIIQRRERALLLTRIELSQQELKQRIEAFGRLAEGPTLFGEARGLTAQEQTLLRQLELRLERLEALGKTSATATPCFSFGLHFGEVMDEGGFDLVVGNPPWVRPHHLTPATKSRLRQRYQVCQRASWAYGAKQGRGRAAGAQVDLAAIFVERALELARPGAFIALLVPAKLFSSLSGGGLRRLALKKASLHTVGDWAEAPEALFDATTYPGLLIARRRKPEEPAEREALVQIERIGASGQPQRFALRAKHLPFDANDHSSPWVLRPAEERFEIDSLRCVGRPLGERFKLMRGAFAGLNRLFIPQSVEEIPGSGLALIRTKEGGEAPIERSCLRPALRGCDVGPFGAHSQRQIIFPYDSDGAPLAHLPDALADYFLAHQQALRARSGLSANQAPWSLFRVRPELLGPKVLWRDISRKPEAVFVDDPRTIALNTLYYAPVSNRREGWLLAAWLNSNKAKQYCEVIAERAHSGYRRYFAWVMANLPWPFEQADRSLVDEVAELSRRLHGPGMAQHEQLNRWRATEGWSPKATEDLSLRELALGHKLKIYCHNN